GRSRGARAFARSADQFAAADLSARADRARPAVVTLALRVIAAPDHVPGSVVPLAGTHAVGAIVEQGAARCIVVDVLCVVETRFSSGQLVIFDQDAELAGQ